MALEVRNSPHRSRSLSRRSLSRNSPPNRSLFIASHNTTQRSRWHRYMCPWNVNNNSENCLTQTHRKFKNTLKNHYNYWANETRNPFSRMYKNASNKFTRHKKNYFNNSSFRRYLWPNSTQNINTFELVYNKNIV